MGAAGSGSASAASPDRRLLSVYLNDHLAGSVAGSHRFERVAQALSGTPVGPDMSRIAAEVADEREQLRGVIAELPVVQNRPKQLLARVGEWLGRVQAAGQRKVRPSRVSTLLGVEVLRSALLGKQGVWETLDELTPALGLEPGRFTGMVEQTRRQLETMDRIHAHLRTRALVDRSQQG